MSTIQKYLLNTGAAVAVAGLFAFANPSEASAQYAEENWEARTVDQIADEIEEQIDDQDEETTVSYTFQWGDTLWGISEATDISVDKLVEVNDIDDRSVIQVDSTIYLSEDGSVISVQNEEEVVSYDISEEEVQETETPEEVEESVEEEPAEEEVSTSSSEEPVEQPAEEPAEEPQAEESQNAPGNLIGTFEATAYAVGDGLTPSTVTANGTDVANSITDASGNRVIAVDPAVIPMGSTVYVELPSGESFYATAADTGSAINGNTIDILMSSPGEATNFGRQNGIRVYSVN